MRGTGDLNRIGEFLPGMEMPVRQEKTSARKRKPPATVTPIQSRLIEAAVRHSDLQSILYQHTIFCQTGMPYRDPGDEVRTWQQSNGLAALEITAGKAMHPKLGRFVELGLPFGPKPRLILAHINTEALLTGKPEIETEKSLTSFVSRTLSLDTNGRNMRVIKDQLGRLSACSIRLGMIRDGQAITVQSQIVTAFSLWLEKDERQRVLWPATIRLSSDYFESLQRHAVPLDEHHLAALSHSAMALDVYAWLAQRLHRIAKGKGAALPWTAVADQFGGSGYERIRKFRDNFKVALAQVQTVYKGARVNVSDKGLMLFHSPSPVPPKLFPTRNPQKAVD
jgi:Plasmid encoded RepA protein